MSALNYPDKTSSSQGIKFLAVVVTTLGLFLLAETTTHADDCAKISDLDKRATCYEKEKEKKEKEYSSVNKKISEIRSRKEEVSQKIQDLASQISVTQAEINQLQAEITSLEEAINELNENLKDRREILAEKELLRDRAIRNWAKSANLSPWENLLSGLETTSAKGALGGIEYLTLNYIFDRALSKDSSNWIRVLAQEIEGFENDKQEALELKAEIAQEQQNLLNVRAALAAEHSQVEEVKGSLEEEEAEKTQKLRSLQEEIARLSAAQQAVLQLKASGGVISGYDAPEYKLPSPPFKPAFALMSYGGFTHRSGMSQYGAKGRAEDGHSYKDIIKFYYDEKVKEKDDFPKKICVEGHGEMDFQKYLYGLAEMPHTWPSEALKAQAVAGRTYAYRYAKDGKCICTTQSCQVFRKDKSDNPPKEWKEAVDKTKNEIVGGSVVTYYSSTTGGWIHNIGWDTSGSWPNDAYEKKAKSPWFYRAWYNHPKDPNSSDTCGRSTPWLTMEEMTDLLNAWVVWKKGSDSEVKKIYPVSKCWSGDGYSMKEMAEKADKYGEKYTNISGVSKPTIANGQTVEICFDTNKGKKCVNGQDFAYVVYIRAPGYVRIEKDVFHGTFLYDIEFKK